MALTAKPGALIPYRAAADRPADFLPWQTTTRRKTLRHPTLAIGKRPEEKEEQRMFFEGVDPQERHQREPPLPGDPNREFVLSIDTADIPQVRGHETRSFEVVIGHASRGGTRSDRPVLFALFWHIATENAGRTAACPQTSRIRRQRRYHHDF